MQTADLEHLEDFKREMGALVEETLYTLDKKKVCLSLSLCLSLSVSLFVSLMLSSLFVVLYREDIVDSS